MSELCIKMGVFSFLEEGKLDERDKCFLIFFSSVFSLMIIWVFFVIGNIYLEIGSTFKMFLIVFSAISIACIVYSIKTALKD